MKTETLVRDSATVIRIVQLSPGDVYKRLHKLPYESTYRIMVGIVQDVVSNGEATAVTALEFQHSYNDVTPKIEVFANDDDLQLFAATPAEVQTYFDEVQAAVHQQMRKAENDLSKARSLVEAVNDAATLVLTQAATETGAKGLDS